MPDIINNGNDLIKSINDMLSKNKKTINASLNNFNNLILTMNKAFHEINESAKVMKKLGINCEKNLLLPLNNGVFYLDPDPDCTKIMDPDPDP